MNQMMGMFGQMMTWPMTMFGEMMSRSMQGMQGMQGLPWMTGTQYGTQYGTQQSLTCPPCAPERAYPCETKTSDWSCSTDSGSCDRSDDWDCRERSDDNWGGRESCGCGCGCRSCRSGDCCRSSCGHSGSDQVKLVQYTVVNVGRGAQEEPVCCQQMVIRDCMTAESFRNQVIAEYARKHPDVRAKNLRVYFKVLDCWCKEDWDYEERQIEVLEEIRNAIGRGDRN